MCVERVSKCEDVAAPLRYTQTVPQARPPYRLSTLPTGARVVSTELADRPSVTMAIMFKVGSRYESDKEAGISHFLEHMFFKGSARYAGAKEIAEAIEGVGGVLNAGTDKELTMYWARVPKTKAKLAIDVLVDMLFQPLLDPPELENERLVVLYVLLKAKKTEQAHVCLGVHAPSYMDRDRHVIDILNCVLGEGMSSRLFLEVREKLGLAYDVHSYVNKMYDTGVLGVYAGTEPRQAARAVGAIVGQLRRLCDEPVPTSELTKAKEFFKGRLLLQMESTNSVATWYGGQEALTGRIEGVDENMAEIDAVTADDVKRIARELFSQALQLAVIGPFRSEAPFLKQIA